MSAQESKAVMSRFTNEFDNPGKLEVADEIIAPECPLYFGSTLVGRGPEAFKQGRVMMYGAFPDLQDKVEEMIAEGDALAQRYIQPKWEENHAASCFRRDAIRR